MRTTVILLAALLCSCAGKPAFDIVATARADGLPEPLGVRFDTVWNFYADHPAAARRMLDGCKTVTLPADDPQRAICDAALLGLHGHADRIPGAIHEGSPGFASRR